MDLASPSPAPSDKPAAEPVVTGAWPASRSSSPAANEPSRSSIVDDVGSQAIAPPTMSVEDRESSPQSTSGVSVEAVVSGSRLPTKSPGATENVTRGTSAHLQTSHSDSGLRDDITELKTSLEGARVSMHCKALLYLCDDGTTIIILTVLHLRHTGRTVQVASPQTQI
jgi:hypothetical protein